MGIHAKIIQEYTRRLFSPSQIKDLSLDDYCVLNRKL